MGKKKKTTLKWSMVRMLFVYWFVPLLIIIMVVMYVVTGKINRQVEHTILTSTEKAIEICDMRLQDAVTASKNASYMQTIRNCYMRYQANGNSRQLYEEVTLYLDQQYQYNSSFKSTMLYFTSEPDKIYYTYRDRDDSTYSSVRQFKSEANIIVQDTAREIDTATVFLRIGNNVYMVRNIVDSRFRPIAVIVMELDTREMFESLESIWNYQSGEVYIDGTLVYGNPEHAAFGGYLQEPVSKTCIYERNQEGASVHRQMKSGRNTVTYGIRLDAVAVVSEMNGVKVIFILEMIFLIPMIIMIFHFLQKKVNNPIRDLIESAQEIEEGHYGCEIRNMSREDEFYYLDDAFNKMSKQLKNQFEKIYLEEIALRDANIMALQSQINPHFLNNTLEIINWEARMMGNVKVSGMIEALSTMLEATMNRKGVQLISLEEELSYVDAYIYIISQRFGEKFAFQKEIEPQLLKIMVPRLIIQPIIENAVEHGMNMTQRGWITLRIYEEEDKVYIEIKDNGNLTDKDRCRIEQLLSDQEVDTRKEHGQKEHATSLGIRNVNRRLKIIYGQDCGLFITSSVHHHTISTIVVKKNGDAQ